MNDHPFDDATPDRESVAQGRRRLLKAAATTAPLIATLPNGAAWATASTNQCIIDSRNGASVDVVTSGDGFVRQNGQEVKIGLKTSTDPQTYKTYYTIDPDDTTYYDVNGNVYALTSDYEVKSKTDVQLLRFFDATSDTGDIANNPTGAANCGDTPIPPQCIYPVDKKATAGNNQALYTSCLCSVNPGLLPQGAC